MMIMGEYFIFFPYYYYSRVPGVKKHFFSF